MRFISGLVVGAVLTFASVMYVTPLKDAITQDALRDHIGKLIEKVEKGE